MPGNVISLIDTTAVKESYIRAKVRGIKIEDWGEMPALLRAFYSGSIADCTTQGSADLICRHDSARFRRTGALKPILLLH